ncbi:MAG: hypothetical protein RBR70_00150 [Arcobacter sp.]|jgi:hypothetical protein|uniref:hypothetical protein n=1 Tax=Arcobacter sp. TaxID=1872629 RepID=UPI002A7558A5|nr:hypothetical protein [Arcobacter sp.]MDY3203465.1 hypothetical protein [Arcobacter sp.]
MIDSINTTPNTSNISFQEGNIKFIQNSKFINSQSYSTFELLNSLNIIDNSEDK